MPAPRRSDNWGFPRWGGYASSRETVTVRLCDRHNCTDPGTCPAPKSPNNPDRWMFCQKHAAEYTSGWDYFEGLNKEEAEARQADETRDNAGFAEAELQLGRLGRRLSVTRRNARAGSDWA